MPRRGSFGNARRQVGTQDVSNQNLLELRARRVPWRGSRRSAHRCASRGTRFHVYIAVEQQNLLGVKEAIFKVLEDAEHYVFVDFCREALDGDLADRRGSVFTHQELALASFLEKEVLAFRETGVRKLDGVAGFLQTNALEFADRPSLPAAVVDAVKRRNQRLLDAFWLLRSDASILQFNAFTDSNKFVPRAR